MQFHAVSSFQNPMNDLMIFVKTWRIQIQQDKLIRTPQDFSSEKSSYPPRRSVRPFLPCQQVSVKVVPTRSTTPRKERTSGKSSCEHESKGHQPLHSIKCLLLECYFGGNYLLSYLGSVVFCFSYCLIAFAMFFFLFLHVFAAFCFYYFLVFPLFLLFCLSRVPAFAALCCLLFVLLLLFL